MPSTEAATSTPVPPRTAVRPTGLAGRPAPPPNRVSADSGTSTPISNRVFPVSSPPGPSARLPGPPQPTVLQPAAGPQGQPGHDEAHAPAHRDAVQPSAAQTPVAAA